MSIELSGEYHKDVNILLDEISRILEARTEQLIGELGRSTRANEEISNLKNENESLRKDAERLDWVLNNCDLGGPPYLDSREEIDEEMAT